jgi:hypothetical protein
LSDVAQLLPPASTDLYVSQGEQAIVCSVIGLAFAFLLGLSSKVPSRLAVPMALLLALTVICYPAIRASALRVVLAEPAELEIEARHPRLVEPLRFTFIDPELETQSNKASSHDRPCRLSSEFRSTKDLIAQSGVLALSRFLETESLGHDWVTITYRSPHQTVKIVGLRSGGLQSERLQEVLETLFRDATVVDDRVHCHDLWPFLVHPFAQAEGTDALH